MISFFRSQPPHFHTLGGSRTSGQFDTARSKAARRTDAASHPRRFSRSRQDGVEKVDPPRFVQPGGQVGIERLLPGGGMHLAVSRQHPVEIEGTPARLPGDRAPEAYENAPRAREARRGGEAQYSGFRERQLVDQLACLLLARNIEQELAAGVVGSPIGAQDQAPVAKLMGIFVTSDSSDGPSFSRPLKVPLQYVHAVVLLSFFCGH